MHAGFNTRCNGKDKATLEFGIILKCDVNRFSADRSKIRLSAPFQTDVNPSFDLNRNFVFRLSLSG